MKKHLIVLSLLTIVFSCSQKIVERALWQNTPVTIDASASEYGDMHLYNSETRMFYSISNDTSNLYLCFVAKDENIQRQLMMVGMEVWIDTTHQSDKQIGILYPLKNEIPDMNIKPGVMADRKHDLSKVRQNFLLSQKMAEMRGFKNMLNGFTTLNTQEGFKLKMEWNNNEALIYEMQIPLLNWYKTISSVDSSKVFTLTVNINAIQRPEMNMSRPMDGLNGGFGEGRPPMDNGRMNAIMAMSEPRTFKLNFKLNTNAK